MSENGITEFAPPGKYENQTGPTIYFNPTGGIEIVNDDQVGKDILDMVGTGKNISPALLFLHEVGHFNLYLKDNGVTLQENLKKDDPIYDNEEEKRVITGIETPAAIKLKVNTRTNHSGIPISTASPISNIKTADSPLINKLRKQRKAIKQAQGG